MKNQIMKIQTVLTAVAIYLAMGASAQTNNIQEDRPYIEVTGSSDLEIVPDEIYVQITIREKYEGREKVTIEAQEEKLKTAMKEVGLDLKNLYLTDANADYVKVKWRQKDVLTKKDYTLKVTNATTVGHVFQQLEKLAINDAYISKTSHSKLDSLRRQVKIWAIKAAKAKADYLLNAIGEQTGKPLIITERENGAQPAFLNYRGGRATTVYNSTVSEDSKDPDIQFNKIKIDAFIYVKFGIK
jgi:uncharacterized protein